MKKEIIISLIAAILATVIGGLIVEAIKKRKEDKL